MPIYCGMYHFIAAHFHHLLKHSQTSKIISAVHLDLWFITLVLSYLGSDGIMVQLKVTYRNKNWHMTKSFSWKEKLPGKMTNRYSIRNRVIAHSSLSTVKLGSHRYNSELVPWFFWKQLIIRSLVDVAVFVFSLSFLPSFLLYGQRINS